MRAGSLDRRIRILRHSAGADNGLGEPAESWTPAEHLWAGKTDISDAERMRAQATGATLTTRFTVRWSSVTAALSAKDRLTCEGRTFDIVGLKEIGRREGIEITAAAQAPA